MAAYNADNELYLFHIFLFFDLSHKLQDNIIIP